MGRDANLNRFVAGGDEADPLDIIGIGFGPSNLALAVCAREIDPAMSCLFFEAKPAFQWHHGMLIDGARMQISFLKDLVSLRNLTSPYSFLQYTKARGRLEHFVNLNEFRPTRIEYDDYLNWVAAAFAEQVRYDTAVTRVSAVSSPRGSLFRVRAENVRTGETIVRFARNIVYAAGGKPHTPDNVALDSRVVHSSQFLHRIPSTFPDNDDPYVFGVVGGGQSAGEIAAYLLDRYDNSQVYLVVSGYAPQPTDNSSFTNEQFYSRSADEFYRFSMEKRTTLLRELRAANYGVIREDLLDQLYQTAYLDAVKGRKRLHMHTCARLSGVEQDGGRLRMKIDNRFGGPLETVVCDAVVLATGYDRSLDSQIFEELLPFIERDELGRPAMSRAYRVRTEPGIDAGLYVQGYGEHLFGLGDTLLSLLPFRSKEIIDDIRARTPAAEYPPRRHLEPDEEKLYAVLERFKFATVVSAAGTDEPVVTPAPLVLDRSRGAKGVLFGHMDRANPQVALLDGRPVLVVFNGPNSYISPWVYDTDQLPTWNSLAVHVRGRAKLLRDRETVVRGLCEIAGRSEVNSRLHADDHRIDKLIGYIVGFEIEIEEMVGRFKLSQDRDECDRRNAALALARATERGERDFIEYATGLSLITDDDPRQLTLGDL